MPIDYKVLPCSAMYDLENVSQSPWVAYADRQGAGILRRNAYMYRFSPGAPR